jgi:hypothetical protein
MKVMAREVRDETADTSELLETAGNPETTIGNQAGRRAPPDSRVQFPMPELLLRLPPRHGILNPGQGQEEQGSEHESQH